MSVFQSMIIEDEAESKVRSKQMINKELYKPIVEGSQLKSDF